VPRSRRCDADHALKVDCWSQSLKPVTPSIDSVSFSCPNCGAHADQFWFDLHAKRIEDHQPPFRFNLAALGRFMSEQHRSEGSVEKFRQIAIRTENGELFFLDELDSDSQDSKALYGAHQVENLALSRCYSCDAFTVWVARSIVHPVIDSDGVPPNEDLPDDIKIDFNEARAILGSSPRGAAALLRLCIQKICKHLGESGENINADIASLVTKGLDARIKKALDVVRVIGNESVHPGQIDLRDDPATAARLFELVNLVADRMISEPRRIDEMYEALPKDKRKAIESRDKKK
jgi:hypothetical protein